MKGKITKITAVVLLLAMLPVFLLLSGFALPSYYQDTYYAVLPEMYRRLTETQGKKIVIVGGSNVAFGTDSALLEEFLAQKGYDYTVCNFGLYAAVGTSAMLEMSKETLNEGDIVILSIEPSSETLSTYFGATAFWKCAEDTPSLLLTLNAKQSSALVGNYIPYLQERYAINLDGQVPKSDDVYAKSSFNDRCDMIYDRAGNAMALGYDTGSPIDLANVTIAPDFAEQVNEYCEAAAKKGATVVMTFSPMNASAMTDTDQAVTDYFNLCNATFSCPIISDPNTYIMDSGWFYDSNFHLNNAGTVIRTASLAQDILVWLGCYEALEYEVPEMPASIANIETNGADTSYFTFSPIGDNIGYLISGLTEEGLAQTSLTVPSAYDGKPVVGFTSDALADAVLTEELRIPESVESLPDELFRSCTKLTRLVLEHTATTCTITESTFLGADQIRIFVPAESYTLYRDGAGCETNLWFTYLERIVTY